MNAGEVILHALEEGKGEDIKIFAAAAQSGGLFERMIIATANSPRHAAALSERVRRALKTAGLPRGHMEKSAQQEAWFLVDAGAVVAHIMLAETRALYDLENLWDFEEEGR